MYRSGKENYEIFLQLHISEKSGRGVPKITEMYGKDAFSFSENSIVVTIPFERINKVGNKVGKKVGDKKPLNSRRQRIIAEMRDNPNITTAELHNILGVSETAVENNISFLRENGYIERVGSKMAGYWKVKRSINDTNSVDNRNESYYYNNIKVSMIPKRREVIKWIAMIMPLVLMIHILVQERK